MVRLYSILPASLLKTDRHTVAGRSSPVGAFLTLSPSSSSASASASASASLLNCTLLPLPLLRPCPSGPRPIRSAPYLLHCSASLLEWSALFPAPLRRSDPLLSEGAERGGGRGRKGRGGGRQEGARPRRSIGRMRVGWRGGRNRRERRTISYRSKLGCALAARWPDPPSAALGQSLTDYT